VEESRREELAELRLRFASDICHPPFRHPAMGHAGKTVGEKSPLDAWGCTTTSGGGEGESVPPPLVEAGNVATYRPPLNVLEPSRFAKINRYCEETSRFVLATSDVRPFERLQALRGPKLALSDLGRGTRDGRSLLAMIHEYNCRELELWTKTDVDGVVIADAWGTAQGLLIAATKWREYFRPLYRQYVEILHAADKFVFFRSAGNIAEILPDLVEIEVDAVHTCWASVGLEHLAQHFRGKITFWGGLDRPELLATNNAPDIRTAVRAVRDALECGSGGVIAQCCWEPAVSLKSLVCFFEAWLL
jgi:hypothetical protein